ncbi:uncharacterized protein SOCE26_064470 [Sorangium cellulosum]|uniref:Uncharacterized protein n=1 Tax=Sorangium cellulosum TaxID=56 RepID=A0A2L0F084_SORCE|nr:uncharacterized protein SOCE26_064470 [Sorangium cellulosum]
MAPDSARRRRGSRLRSPPRRPVPPPGGLLRPTRPCFEARGSPHRGGRSRPGRAQRPCAARGLPRLKRLGLPRRNTKRKASYRRAVPYWLRIQG